MYKDEIKNHIDTILKKKMTKSSEKKLPKAENASFNIYSESFATCISIDLVSFKNNILKSYPREDTVKIIQAFTSTAIKIGKEQDYFVSAYINGDQVILCFSTPSYSKDLEIYQIAIKINSAINILMPKVMKNNGYNKPFSAGIGIWASSGNSLVRYGEKGSSEESYTTLIGDAINNSTRLSDLANRNGNPKMLMNYSAYKYIKEAGIEGVEELKYLRPITINGENLYGTNVFYSIYGK